MTKKEKELAMLISSLKGREIKAWISKQAKTDEPFLEGTVVDFTGSYIILKHVLLWNGHWHDEYRISSRMLQFFDPKPLPQTLPIQEVTMKEISPGVMEIEISIQGIIVTNPNDNE